MKYLYYLSLAPVALTGAATAGFYYSKTSENNEKVSQENSVEKGPRQDQGKEKKPKEKDRKKDKRPKKPKGKGKKKGKKGKDSGKTRAPEPTTKKET